MPVPTPMPATNGAAAPPKAIDPSLALTQKFIRPNVLKDKMAAGGLGFSYGMTMAHTAEIVHMAAVSGYTALLMNLEHHRTSIETAADMCCAALNCGITPVCVVPSLQNDWISRLLDNGAQGIIVPRVNNADMAREMVRFSKHRPLGERPLAFTPQMQYHIPNFVHTQAAQDATTLTIPMIETLAGLENCEAIAKVPGIDMLFVGVFDLSDEMGIGGEYDNPRVWDALGRICRAAEDASDAEHTVYIGLGGLEPRPDLVARLRKEHDNVRFVMAGRDMSILLQGMGRQVEKMNAIQAGDM